MNRLLLSSYKIGNGFSCVKKHRIFAYHDPRAIDYIMLFVGNIYRGFETNGTSIGFAEQHFRIPYAKLNDLSDEIQSHCKQIYSLPSPTEIFWWDGREYNIQKQKQLVLHREAHKNPLQKLANQKKNLLV